MANIKPKRVPDTRSLDAALVAADAAGDTINNSENHANIALVRNAGAGACTVTVNRTGDTDLTVVIPAGATYLIRVASARRLAYSTVAGVTVGFFSV